MRALKNYIFIFILALLLLPVLVLTFSEESPDAFAASTVTFDYAECRDFDGDTVMYDTVYLSYARNIVLYYEINSPYYIIEVQNKAGTIITFTQAIEPVAGRGEYEITDNGELTVYCYATDDQGVKLQNTRIYTIVKSDNLSPQQAKINQMTEWKRHANGYLVNIELDVDNGNSDINKADIAIIYDEQNIDIRTVVSPINTDSFMIYQQCKIAITVYDNAGNARTDVHDFNLFDSIPPTPPAIIATPNVEVGENTNGYAGSYYVNIAYGEDTQSGIKQGSIECFINGEDYEYTGGFYLNEQRNYYITVYYSDNAGNVSETVSLNITNIDKINPSLSDVTLIIDLMQEIPYTISLACNDTESGLNRIEAEGINVTFYNKIYNIYEGKFSSLDKAQIKITVFDNVGNFRTTNLITHHFSDLDLEEMAIYYHESFLELDSSQYSENGWDTIIQLYTDLNIMFMSQDTDKVDFENKSKQIDEAIEGQTDYSYRIIKAPLDLNARFKYTVNNPNDLNNHKKGDKFLMTLNETEYDANFISEFNNIARNKIDFSEFFISTFKLDFYHNDNEIDYDLTNGITVTMPVPFGYEARYFAVFNMDSNEMLDIEVINNTITFTVKSGGCFALITEGGKLSETAPEVKGIKIFGKTISYLAFGLSLSGVVLFFVLAVTLLTLRYQKPSANNRK